MTSENVRVVQEALDAYGQRDVEAMRRVTSPDVVLDWSASVGWLAGVYRGFEEVMSFYADFYAAFGEIVIEPDCFREKGDSVVVPNLARQRGRDGIEVTARATFVFTVQHERITSIRLFQETGDALKAVGLEP